MRKLYVDAVSLGFVRLLLLLFRFDVRKFSVVFLLDEFIDESTKGVYEERIWKVAIVA